MHTDVSPAARRRTLRRALHITTTHLPQHPSPPSPLTIFTTLTSSPNVRLPCPTPSETRTPLQKVRRMTTTTARILTPPITSANSRTSPMVLIPCDLSALGMSAHQPRQPTSAQHLPCRIPRRHRIVSHSHTHHTLSHLTADLFHPGHMAHRTHQNRLISSHP